MISPSIWLDPAFVLSHQNH